MKKKYGLDKAVPICHPAVLSSMSTKELLSRLEQLRRCEESPEMSDMTPDELALAPGILFKNTAAWATAYRDVRQALSTREHVASGVERKHKRSERAQRNQTSEKRRRR